MSRSGPCHSALRPFLTLALALVMALVSVQIAVGRADARAALAMELCIDDSVEVVLLDARGNPVDHAACCLDCMAGGPPLADAAPPLAAPPTRLAARLARRAGRAVAPPRRHPGPPPARGPPALS